LIVDAVNGTNARGVLIPIVISNHTGVRRYRIGI